MRIRVISCNILPGLICIWIDVYEICVKTFWKEIFVCAPSFLVCAHLMVCVRMNVHSLEGTLPLMISTYSFMDIHEFYRTIILSKELYSILTRFEPHLAKCCHINICAVALEGITTLEENERSFRNILRLESVTKTLSIQSMQLHWYL